MAGALAALGVVAAALGAWWLWGRQPETPAGRLRIVPFTADGGVKFAPRLSPDGERVAYGWAGPDNDNADIYVKAIGRGTKALRLTENEALDWGPVWSPDGRQIAFVRGLETETAIDGAAIYTVPSLGGQERRLIDIAGPAASPDGVFTYPFLSWSPDGEWLALGERPREDEPARIVRVSLATLEKTPLTSPPADFLGDLYPAISPDGRQLAFVRYGPVGWGQTDVWVQSASGPQARQLTFENYGLCSGLAWTADGAELVFSTDTNGFTSGGQIVRLPLAGGDPTPLAGIGRDVAGPSVRAGRMVLAQLFPAPWNIWRIPGRGSSVADRKAERLIATRWNDQNSVYSPDGHRIAFVSDRSGTNGVWVSDEDGSDPTLVASESGLGSSRSPWSPDSRRILVVSLEFGNLDLYLVDSEGGVPQRLTHEPSADGSGSFSRDGRSIYFTSDRSGSAQIWKMPAGGGPASQVTAKGGQFARESWDAHSMYYSKHTGEDYEIWRVPVQGGEETFVLRVREPSVLSGWDLSPAGIYYATGRPLYTINAEYTVRFLDFETGRTETLFRKEGPFWHWSFSVSPDEKWILFGEQPATQSELMLVENFR